MTDETLAIERVLQGDTESFRLLVERYEKSVVRMIRNTTGVTQSCDDLAQDVFLTAFAKLHSFDPARSRFSTWLLTIARNKSINHLKRKRPTTRGEFPARVDDRTPLAMLAQQEAFARLDQALASLPARQRRAFALAEFEGLPYEQIARIEGTRVGTIKSRVSRARTKLTEALRQCEANDQ
ncbi:MAG: sigma-70 family RNA polymerase sigma factor [Phycisphaerales bacterium]|nr:MAG: sigma-70 family RNA polymerase sigma factor [Phycisphaerales bacterium]